MQLIDWAERFPNETSLMIAIRQSTVCVCGQAKEIGQRDCGCLITGECHGHKERNS